MDFNFPETDELEISFDHLQESQEDKKDESISMVTNNSFYIEGLFEEKEEELSGGRSL